MFKPIKKKYTCLLFGEGRRDRNFLYALTDLEKFKYHTKNWVFRFDSAHGCSAMDILACCKRGKTRGEDLTLCFIDLDDLKNDYLGNWKQKKLDMEKTALDENIIIIWQIEKAEDEYKRVLGEKYKNLSKHKINNAARKNITSFINSSLWKRILKPLRDYEKNLKENN